MLLLIVFKEFIMSEQEAQIIAWEELEFEDIAEQESYSESNEKTIVFYLGKKWEVNSFQDFACQVQSYYKADFVTGWANGLNDADYTVKKVVYDAIQLKALVEFWKAL